jgi:zinc transport system ATP-binding protein
MSSPLISCRDVSFAYEGVPALRKVNFGINAGDYLCIVGENGSGKSTLIKGLLRLKLPESGELIFHESLKRNQIGYLPQQTNVQRDFPASVYEVVLSGCLGTKALRPFYAHHDKTRALATMERLGVLALRTRCYRELSGGQQQRVLLARALCATHKLLLLDEPGAGLDPKVARELYAEIRRLNRSGHITQVMVTHDLRLAVKEASHILHLAGRQLYFGTTKDYLHSQVAADFLGEELCL